MNHELVQDFGFGIWFMFPSIVSAVNNCLSLSQPSISNTRFESFRFCIVLLNKFYLGSLY